MVMVTIRGAVEPFCCWLRPCPSTLHINQHYTYNKILEAVKLQGWFPPNYHYCRYRPKHVDDYERHVVREHQGKLAYPGPPPKNVAQALYTVEEELMLQKDDDSITMIEQTTEYLKNPREV